MKYNFKKKYVSLMDYLIEITTEFMKIVDFFRICDRISTICKSYAETKQCEDPKREGIGESPRSEHCKPLPSSPG